MNIIRRAPVFINPFSFLGLTRQKTILNVTLMNFKNQISKLNFVFNIGSPQSILDILKDPLMKISTFRRKPKKVRKAKRRQKRKKVRMLTEKKRRRAMGGSG